MDLNTKTMQPTLLVLAAGMGSRYGGLKQLDGVGPSGETIMDYSIFDAIRGGFGKVVFVIRRDFENDFREKVLSKYSNHIPVEVVFQGLDTLPEPFKCPSFRVKPWCTNHAVLMGKDVINEPFAVINADDFYGKEGFEALAKQLKEMWGKENEYCMVGYRVGNTLSESGTVARGVCVTDKDGNLTDVVERTKVMRVNGVPSYKEGDDKWIPLKENTPVSMNMWGFTPDYFKHSEKMFIDFLKEKGQEEKSEYFIPSVVNSLIKNGTSKVKVLDTDATWFGVTYATDREGVVNKIQALVNAGVYPSKLNFN